MPLFDARDILSFPGGNNANDTIIAGINFNLTTLQHWNYTLYSNGTLSNWSNCFLTFEPYTPRCPMAFKGLKHDVEFGDRVEEWREEVERGFCSLMCTFGLVCGDCNEMQSSARSVERSRGAAKAIDG